MYEDICEGNSVDCRPQECMGREHGGTEDGKGKRRKMEDTTGLFLFVHMHIPRTPIVCSLILSGDSYDNEGRII